MSLHSPNSLLHTLLTLNDAVATTQDLGEPPSHTHSHRTLRGHDWQPSDRWFPFPFQSQNRHWAVWKGQLAVQKFFNPGSHGQMSFSLQTWYRFLIPIGSFQLIKLEVIIKIYWVPGITMLNRMLKILILSSNNL